MREKRRRGGKAIALMLAALCMLAGCGAQQASNSMGTAKFAAVPEAEELFLHPLHPYTKALFSAIPVPDPNAKMNRIVLEGSIPSPANPPEGCKFHTRCKYCTERCKAEVPQQREVEPGHFVVCHLYDR